jgi:hypothetical protein
MMPGQGWPNLHNFQLRFSSWDSTLQTVSGHDQLETTRIGHSEKPKVLGGNVLGITGMRYLQFVVTSVPRQQWQERSYL